MISDVESDVSTCKSYFTKYLVQAIYQHANVYFDYYKIPKDPPLTCQTADPLTAEISARAQQELAAIRK